METVGIDDATLRTFRVGYAPGDTRDLVSHLDAAGHGLDQLVDAGLASRSDRSRVHVLFHARLVFPFTTASGRVSGFAGLATHLGPSWPLWLTSPTAEGFDSGAAMFGLREAVEAIGRRGRVLIVRDCVQVLALHQAGRRDVVAVIHSPITRAHMNQLADLIGVQTSALHFARRDDRLGVLGLETGAEVDEADFAARDTPAGFNLIDPKRGPIKGRQAYRPVAALTGRPPGARRFVYIGGAVIGIGIPVGLLLLAAPHNESAQGSTPTLNIVIGGLAAAYFVLAVIVARASAKARDRSKGRRMREPWARGMGEWQPTGWTYHRFEEILVGAALASAITCLVLLMTVGGFLG